MLIYVFVKIITINPFIYGNIRISSIAEVDNLCNPTSYLI